MVVLHRFLTVAAVLLPAFGPARVVAQGRDPAVTAELARVLDSVRRSRTDIPGIAVHLESPRLGLSWTGVSGVADPTTGAPLTPGHGHRIASNTKTYVAAAILRLWEDGRLRLDDPIARHLAPASVAAIRGGGYDPERITVRHLLSHTSGLYDYGMDSLYQVRVGADPRHRWTRMEQLEFAMNRGRPYGEPGEVYHYADTGYILLGEMVERLTGQPFGPALRQVLRFDALGLRETWLESLEPQPSAVAGRAHQLMGSADTHDFDPSLDLYGGGGYVATTRDLAVFARALFAGGLFRRPTTIDTMLTRVGAIGDRGYRYGLAVDQLEGYRAAGHTGFWNTFVWYFPELDLAIAGSIQQNAAYAAAGPLALELLRRVVPARAELTRGLRAAVARAVADTSIPGAALHVESPRLALNWSGATGIDDRSTGRPLRASQPVRIASNTKTYTAAAILRLVEQGKIGLDDPASRHLPPDLTAIWRRGGYDPDRITVRHLLHHVSGTVDHATEPAFVAAATGNPDKRWTRAEQVTWAVEHGKVLGAPGTVFHYSDTGYILLGAMIERLTGLTLGAAFRELLGFDRIGLTRTWLETIDPEPWFGGERAHQYLGAIDTRAHDPSFDLYGGGGLAAPVRDMAAFTRALMTGKVFAKPATLTTMLERPAGVTAERDYRMGIYRRVVDGVEGFGHTGFWGTFSFHFPALDLTVAGVVTQQGRGQVLGRMLEDAVRAVRTASGSLGLTPSQD